MFFEDCADLEYRNCAQGLRSSGRHHYTTSDTPISTGEKPPLEKSRSRGTLFGDPKSATWPFWVEKRRLDDSFTNYIQQGKGSPLASADPQIQTVPFGPVSVKAPNSDVLCEYTLKSRIPAGNLRISFQLETNQGIGLTS